MVRRAVAKGFAAVRSRTVVVVLTQKKTAEFDFGTLSQVETLGTFQATAIRGKTSKKTKDGGTKVLSSVLTFIAGTVPDLSEYDTATVGADLWSITGVKPLNGYTVSIEIERGM